MFFFFFQAEDGIRDLTVTGVQTCALPISSRELRRRLFERSVLRPGLSAPELDRYRLASALAAACARAWEARYGLQGRLDAVLPEARRTDRLAGGEKISAFAHGAVGWAACHASSRPAA